MIISLGISDAPSEKSVGAARIVSNRYKIKSKDMQLQQVHVTCYRIEEVQLLKTYD